MRIKRPRWSILLLGFFSLLLLRSAAQAWPAWVEAMPKDNKVSKYYLGRSDDEASEQLAIAAAFKDAYEAAIRENFGFQAQIDIDDFATTKETTLLKRVKESTRRIQMNGFEQVEFNIAHTGSGRYSARALYTYSKSAIALERARLEKSKGELDTEPSVVGSEKQGMGSLEISSNPAGARVAIDGEPMATTPVRILGQVAPGPHVLRLDHPYFKVMEQIVLAVPGTSKRIAVNLEPAFGELKINSNLSGTKISINGNPVGETPLTLTSLQAGVAYRIDAEQPQGFAQTIHGVVLGRDEVRLQNFVLTLKSSELLITVPADCEAQTDNRTLTAGFSRVKVPAGVYSVDFKCAGFQTANKAGKINPDEKRPVSVQRDDLLPNQPTIKWHLSASDFLGSFYGSADYREATLKGIPCSTDTVGLGVDLMYKYQVGLNIGGGASFGQSNSDNIEFGIQDATLFHIYPYFIFYASETANGVMLFGTGPEYVGSTARYYSKALNGQDVAGPSKSQSGLGWSTNATYLGSHGAYANVRGGALQFSDVNQIKGGGSAFFELSVGWSFGRILEVFK